MVWEVVNSRDMQDGGHSSITTLARDLMQVTKAGPGTHAHPMHVKC